LYCAQVDVVDAKDIVGEDSGGNIAVLLD